MVSPPFTVAEDSFLDWPASFLSSLSVLFLDTVAGVALWFGLREAAVLARVERAILLEIRKVYCEIRVYSVKENVMDGITTDVGRTLNSENLTWEMSWQLPRCFLNPTQKVRMQQMEKVLVVDRAQE
jgi:hypothetical protein